MTALRRRITAFASTHRPTPSSVLSRFRFRKASARFKDQRGFQLIEILVTLGILGVLGPISLMSLAGAYRSTHISDEHIQAEALARNQHEALKEAAYLDCDPTPCYTPMSNLPFQYSITIDVQILDDRAGDTCINQSNCNTLQEVAVTISRTGGRDITTVSSYKMKK